nr:uncharacterized protein LOC109181111 [Ipomoea trifida]
MPPQVDLETLVSACAGGGTDRKIACETLVEDTAGDKEDSAGDDDAGREAPPDFPPESFWLSKDAEIDCKPANIRLFPAKRTVSIEKVAAEPSSPKVSCMGRVRSKRGCRKSSSTREKPTEDHPETGGEKRRTGFYSRLLSMFRSNRSHKSAKNIKTEPKREEPGRKSVKATKMRDVPISAEPVAEPPGLGGMRRLSSARKSESWAAEEIKAAISEAFETDRRRASHNG